jgi:MFS family permease
LLRGNASFRSLWTARLLSFSGDSVGLIALLLYTAARFHSGLAVALLMVAGDFVPGLISPLAGAVSDRWDRRTVMVSCELVQCALVAAIALTLPPLPLLLLLVAAQSCVAAVFQPASRSAVPGLVADADLERAHAAVGFATNGMDAFAPLAGARCWPGSRSAACCWPTPGPSWCPLACCSPCRDSRAVSQRGQPSAQPRHSRPSGLPAGGD